MNKTLRYFYFCLSLITISSNINAKILPSFNSGVDFQHYHAILEPDFDKSSISGEVTVSFTVTAEDMNSLSFSAIDKNIIDVTSDYGKLSYNIINKRLVIKFSDTLTPNKQIKINVAYESKPQKGVKFYTDHIFTLYHTNHWLISHWNIADKATFTLDLIHSEDFVSVGNGKLISQRALPKKRMMSRWHQSIPVSTYIFGFAVGQFDKISDKNDTVTFNYLSRPNNASGFDKHDINNIFIDVNDMKMFFEDKAGFALPNENYSFIFVNGRVAQEASGFTLVGEQWGHILLDDFNENWFIAHELAHEWWGNSITCKTFAHFWLNEGLVQFLVSAYKGHKFGPEAYKKEIELAINRVKKAQDNGKGGPVAYKYNISEKDINHTMVYNKGALAFHKLKHKLGERVFWQALKHYSLTHKGGSVITQDLKTAFEHISNQDLTEFFEQWVYGEKVHKVVF